MNALLKLRPGLFGLLFAAIALSSLSTAIGKTPRPTARSTGNVQSGALPSEQPEATAEPASQDEQPVYTYLQYQIDTDLVNLEQTVRNRAAAHLEQGKTEPDLNNLLYDLGQTWQGTPEQLTQRLAIHRAMQTIKDGEPAPAAGAIQNPTVEDFQNVSATE